MLRDTGHHQWKDRRDEENLEEPQRPIAPHRSWHPQRCEAKRRGREETRDNDPIGAEVAEPWGEDGAERGGDAGREDDQAADLERRGRRDAE